jgi:hypothetical protein
MIGAMPPVPYSLEVPNDDKRHELGPEGFARLVRNAAERFLEEIPTRIGSRRAMK